MRGHVSPRLALVWGQRAVSVKGLVLRECRKASVKTAFVPHSAGDTKDALLSCIWRRMAKVFVYL